MTRALLTRVGLVCPLIAPLRRTVIAVAVFTSLAVSSARAVCPASQVYLYANPILSTGTAYDTANSDGSKHVTFDISRGSLTLDQCCSLAPTSVKVIDSFDVTGVPTGTPVTMTAQLISDCFVIVYCETGYCSGIVVDSLELQTHGDGRRHAVEVGGRSDFHDVLSVPLTIVAGTPESVSYMLTGWRVAGNSSESGGSGKIVFSGLPPGVNVVSCKGYSLAQVLDVPPARVPDFALNPPWPSPAAQTARVSFRLPDAARARLELMDIAGRVVWGREVGTLGPGTHVLPVGDVASRGAGVYFVRLVRGDQMLARKLVVMR